ncbi:hypothetical protein PMIN06_002928 [Paraphaeosphaeria minitans]
MHVPHAGLRLPKARRQLRLAAEQLELSLTFDTFTRHHAPLTSVSLRFWPTHVAKLAPTTQQDPRLHREILRGCTNLSTPRRRSSNVLRCLHLDHSNQHH